jgi:ketosteroid isomerase-like protein
MSPENAEVVSGVRYPVSLPSERAGQRRSLDERLFVRFPALYRLFADAWMRLPLRSRLRRLPLTRLVGRACAAANRRDFDLLVLGLDPSIEYRPRGDQMPLDMDGVFYGHDGYRAVWRGMAEAFDDLRLVPEEVLDLGDRLLTTAQVKGHGSGSGVPVSAQLFQVIKLRQGLVVWQQDFGDRSEALEAAGPRR